METIERDVKFAAIDNRIPNAADFISRISSAAGPYTFSCFTGRNQGAPTPSRVTGTIKFGINSRRDFLPSFRKQLEESAMYLVQLQRSRFGEYLITLLPFNAELMRRIDARFPIVTKMR